MHVKPHAILGKRFTCDAYTKGDHDHQRFHIVAVASKCMLHDSVYSVSTAARRTDADD